MSLSIQSSSSIVLVLMPSETLGPGSRRLSGCRLFRLFVIVILVLIGLYCSAASEEGSITITIKITITSVDGYPHHKPLSLAKI